MDPVLVAFGVHEAADRGLPIQVHTGLGDRDLDLNRADPLHLLPLIRAVDVPVLLLHCYPFHRNAGYLAQAFDHVSFDVGLAINHLGARSVELVGEAMELAPFAKQLYSSDAYGLPELHYLGAQLWRRAMGVGARRVGTPRRLVGGRRGPRRRPDRRRKRPPRLRPVTVRRRGAGPRTASGRRTRPRPCAPGAAGHR